MKIFEILYPRHRFKVNRNLNMTDVFKFANSWQQGGTNKLSRILTIYLIPKNFLVSFRFVMYLFLVEENQHSNIDNKMQLRRD